MAQEIASFYASIGADVKDFKKGLGDVKDDMSSLDKTTAALGTAFKAAFALGVAGVVAFTAAIGKSVNAAADMEQGVADIGAMMSLTDEDTQKLGDHILDLGLDPKLKVSATEASSAIMALGTAGLEVSEILGGASEATVLLANATGLKGGAGLASAAEIATDVMAQFNMTASQMNSAVSQIAGTTVASKFTIDDYRLAIAQAGGVAGSVGVEFDDFNAIIAASASSFASGSDAGTSFKTFLGQLVPSTDKAAEAMDELGLRTADGASKFFDASGAMKSAEEIAGLLHTAFSGLSEAQSISAAKTIFGGDAWRTAFALAKGGIPIITKMKQEIGNVDAETLAAKRMDTFRGAMEIAQGIIETITISIGNKFLPVLRPMVEKFTELAQKHGPMLIEFFGKLASQMSIWITKTISLSEGTGALWEKLDGVWAASIKIYDAVKEGMRPITDAIAGFVGWKDVMSAVAILMAGALLSAIGGVVVALWPVIQTVALVTAAVAAMRWAWQNDLGGVRTDVLNTVNKISDWFYEASGIWKGTWEETGAYIADRIRYFFKYQIPNTIIGFKEDVVGFFAIAWRIAKETTIKKSQEIYDTIAGWVNDVKAKLTNWKDIVISTWKAWTDPTKKEISDWVSITKSKLDNWVAAMKANWTEFKDKAIEKWQAMIDWWDRNINPWIQRGRDLVQSIWDGALEVWRKFRAWWDDIWSRDIPKTVDVKMKMGSPSKVMEDYGKWTMQGFAIGAKDALPMVTDAMSGMSYAAMGAGADASQSGVSTSRIEQLLEVLIAELRNKNMSVTVNGGGGSSYGALVTHTAGMR